MTEPTSPRVSAALAELGSNLAEARRRRSMSQDELARRAGVSRDTVHRLESGSPVGADSLASVLQALNLLDDLTQLGTLMRDPLGQSLLEQQTPRRGRSPRP